MIRAGARAGGVAGPGAGPGLAGWLHLAATPTFALMAVLTGVFGGGAMDMVCGGGGVLSPIGGMTPMYALMSAFHAPPWLRLFSGR